VVTMKPNEMLMAVVQRAVTREHPFADSAMAMTMTVTQTEVTMMPETCLSRVLEVEKFRMVLDVQGGRAKTATPFRSQCC